MAAGKRGKNVKRKKWIARVALLGAIMMISGCALGVSEALIDNIDGLSIARGNAADHFGNGEFPGNGGQTGGGTTGGGNPRHRAAAKAAALMMAVAATVAGT